MTAMLKSVQNFVRQIIWCHKKCIVWGLDWYVPIGPCALAPTRSRRASVRQRHTTCLQNRVVAPHVWVEFQLPGTTCETLYLNPSFVCVRNIICIHLLPQPPYPIRTLLHLRTCVRVSSLFNLWCTSWLCACVWATCLNAVVLCS